MNKSAEQQAEEKYPKPKYTKLQHTMDFSPVMREAFIAGYHSRDSEVKKLVEVLEDLLFIFRPMTLRADELVAKAKEAIKPYQNS